MGPYDYIVVGCGLSGSVIARNLADSGKRVLIIDRRNHIGGNMYDYRDSYGILVHQYGPHTFHTNDADLYNYMCKYEDWREYRLTCMTQIDNVFTPTPFNYSTIDSFYPLSKANLLKNAISDEFGSRELITVVELLNASNDQIRDYARFLFEKDYSLYTAKQWGVSPQDIDPSVLNRVPVRMSYRIGYFDDTYQVMPKNSYTSFFKQLLDNPNITVKLGVKASALFKIREDNTISFCSSDYEGCGVVYSGPLDELLSYRYGSLPYRSLRFEWRHSDNNSIQDAPVVAYPQAEGYTRITEYNKLPVQETSGSSYAVEYPLPFSPETENEPYYPVLTKASIEQYSLYKKDADSVPNFHYCGRLADFKYYNMDQALRRALSLYAEELD